MSESSPGRHAAGGPPSSRPAVAEPSHAERAKTLVTSYQTGTLSTHSKKQPGFPFGSVMPYGLDGLGQPVFLISSMAMHTQNLEVDPRASLLVMQPSNAGDVLGAGRVTLIGNARKASDAEKAEARARYLAAYQNAKYWVDYEDFSFYRLDVIDVYFVGGFGVMGWVAADEYLAAGRDPLADHAAAIIEHMNADHVEAMILLGRVHAGLEGLEAQMTSVDRLGFHLRLRTAEGMKGARVAFKREARDAGQAREVLVEMVNDARGGWS